MFVPKRTSRSVDYLLAALSPLEVSRATRAYLAALPQTELDALIERSRARMDDDERAYLAMSPDFATFLEQNRRALRTLDTDALRAILMPVILSRSAAVDGTEEEPLRSEELSSALRAALPPLSTKQGLRRISQPGKDAWRTLRRSFVALDRDVAGAWRNVCLSFAVLDRALGNAYRRIWPTLVRVVLGLATACGVVAAGAAIALLLVSVVIPAGKSTMAWLQASSIAHAVRAAQSHPAIVARHRRPARHTIVVAQHTVAPATPKPRPTASATPTLAPTPSAKPRVTPSPAPTPVRVAAAARRPAPRKRIVQTAYVRPTLPTVTAGTMPSRDPALIQRARLIVMSYLDSLMRGDASAALGNLGLSASAGTSNLTEAPILAGATEFKIVRAALADGQSAKVQVVIDSPQGRFFGDYIVTANGPAAWITQHEVIPVESTAGRRHG